MIPCPDRPRCNRRGLFYFNAGVLDHLAPALFLAAKISIERFGGLCDHHEALVDAEPLESLGLDGNCGRLVEALDDVGWRFGRRQQAIPALRGVAGNTG